MLDDLTANLDRLAEAALGGYGLPADTEIALLNLSENATFRLRDGERELILRVHRSGYHTHQEIASELAWAAALRNDTELDTPRVVPTAEGEDVLVLRASPLPDERYCVAFEVMPGVEPSSHDLLSWAARLGAVTATLHRHAIAWNPPSWFTRPAWDWETIAGGMPRWGRWQTHAHLDHEGRRLLTRAAGRIAERIERYGGPATRGLVHADMRLANLLVSGDAVGVIDFDDCGPGFFLWDLATVLTFIEDDPVAPAAVAAWLDGYRAQRPLEREDLAEIPTFVMLRRLQILAWLASHADTDVARAEDAPYAAATLALAERYLADDLLRADV